MTRPGGRKGGGEAIAELFATSAPDAVLRVLRESGRALAKSEILDQLAAVGVPRARADRAWSQAQKRLRHDSRVIAEKDRQIVRYRWNPQPAAEPGAEPAAAPAPPPSPADALAMLVDGRLTQGERQALAETIRAALAAAATREPTPPPAAPEPTPPAVPVEPAETPPATDGMVPASRLRQVELDAARELAGMAIDVEEQATKGASAKAIIHRVRARMKRLRLEPVGRSGEQVAFDRRQHEPMRAGIPDGATVLVVRPGYIWRLPGEDLVIEKPVVQD